METRANYAIVGLFTIAAILAAFGFVYWTAGFGDRGEVVQLRVRIPGSASGLGRGSAVLFNGVKVGDVRRVFIDVNNPEVAIADTLVDRLTPITPSTRADVGLAGLTGQANIELKGGNPSEKNLLDEAEEEGRIAEIVASPSAVTNLLQTAQSILTRADSVVSKLEGFIGDNTGPLSETVENIRQFSEALGRNSKGVDAFLDSVAKLSDTMGGVSDQLETTLKSADDLFKAFDREKIESVVANVEAFTKDLQQAGGKLDGVMTKVDRAVASIDEFSKNASGTLTKVDEIISSVDGTKVASAIDSFDKASGTIATAAEDVAKVTSRIAPHAEDVDRIIANAREISEKLNAASTRVDGVLAKLDTLLGSDDAQGVMAQASEAIRSFRQVADTLNARMGTITDGLARFSGQGLRDLEALIRDSRRSISRIEQAITDLERNPQRIITGGAGSVREYDGRARR